MPLPPMRKALAVGRILFLVFLSVPLIEIGFFIVVGQAIGLWPTLAGVVVTAVVGSIVLRVQGLSLINEIRQTVGRGQLPARAIADAMMVGLAGLLLLRDSAIPTPARPSAGTCPTVRSISIPTSGGRADRHRLVANGQRC